MIVKSQPFTQAQLPAQIFGNDELTCGKWLLNPVSRDGLRDSNTPIAGDTDFFDRMHSAGQH
jgi:hypothetical protein